MSRGAAVGLLAAIAAHLTYLSIRAGQLGDHPKAVAALACALVVAVLARQEWSRTTMQTVTVDLPGDHWAKVRHVDELKAGDAKAVRREVKMDAGNDGVRGFGLGIADDMRDALLARIITDWSYDLPIPAGDRSSLDELPLDAYNKLVAETEEHWSRVDFTPGKSSKSTSSSGSRPSSDANGSQPDSSPLVPASTP